MPGVPSYKRSTHLVMARNAVETKGLGEFCTGKSVSCAADSLSGRTPPARWPDSIAKLAQRTFLYTVFGQSRAPAQSKIRALEDSHETFDWTASTRSA